MKDNQSYKHARFPLSEVAIDLERLSDVYSKYWVSSFEHDVTTLLQYMAKWIKNVKRNDKNKFDQIAT